MDKRINNAAEKSFTGRFNLQFGTELVLYRLNFGQWAMLDLKSHLERESNFLQHRLSSKTNYEKY
jgi:hypothetical protein